MKNISFLLIFLLYGCGNSTNNYNIESLPNDDNKTQSHNTNQTKIYGKPKNREISIKTYPNSVLYRPKDINTSQKMPVVLFAPGWGSQNHYDYKALLSFVAKAGCIVIYVKSPMEYSATTSINRYFEVLNDESVYKYCDINKLGIIGHSSGGGIAFNIMYYFTKLGYGDEGRFIFSMDPWFAFGMSEKEFRYFPKDTKVIIQQYLDHASTDPRIALSIYDHISLVGNKNRDYQVYSDLNHGYPFGANYDKIQTILKPLDALMDYVFNTNQSAYKFALNLGSDNPYENGSQPVLQSVSYDYKCYAENNNLTSALSDIDYCKIVK